MTNLTIADLVLCGTSQPFFLNEGERVLWIRNNGDGTALVRIAFPSGMEDVVDADVAGP